MSLYSECSNAAGQLMADPPEGNGGVFTEIDVVNRASKPGWSKENYKAALKQASQVLGTLYRSRRLVRFGPVVLPDGDKDYARIAEKIVYASAIDGPTSWQTPNGVFPALKMEDDKIGRQGRRKSTNRNDWAKWSDQNITSSTVKAAPELPATNGREATPDEAGQIERLQADLSRAYKEIEAKEQEIHRLREHKAAEGAEEGAQGDLRALVEEILIDLVGDLDSRVAKIETRERERAELYARR